jgi:hypothetical protein
MRQDIDEVESVQERLIIYESIAGVTDKVMKTREMLLKLEDRMFLNPTARIKAIPKQPPEEKKESAMAEFLKRRGANAT